jgi:hypothetical protein
MAPPKQPPKTEAQAVASGNFLLTDFFAKKKCRRGRPKKRGNLADDNITVLAVKKAKSGRPPSKARVAKKPSFEVTKKPSRTNWGKGKQKERLSKAIDDWDSGGGNAIDSNGEPVSLTAFSNRVGIPYNTLRQYIKGDKEKRRTVGKSVGQPPLIKKKDQEFVAQVLARLDRANDGATLPEAIDIVQQLDPDLSRQQARMAFRRTVHLQHPTLLKPKLRVAQSTTTKRSAITVMQQYRWHTTYESALNELRRRNTGVCKVTGKSFGELIHHFIVGGDETCFMASAQGTVKVVASVSKTKHEKKDSDSRSSITLYRTGNVNGNTGPTVFVMEGVRARQGFNDAFLRRHGGAVGSTFVMTPTAYMTTEAWEEITPSICKGLRAINKIVEGNPDWWMLEVFDGFGAHLLSLKAMVARFDNKILALKEEGDSSHVNQAYDKYVAKEDKVSKTESLAMLRSAKHISKGVVDQWGLVHVGLYAVRATKPETWTTSF